MKIKELLFALFMLVPVCSVAEVQNVRLFSTSTDWQALTGFRLAQYKIAFTNVSGAIGKGMTLYYLDGFPCYGFGDSARVWLGPKKQQDGELRIACVYLPRELKFAWQYAERDDLQSRTTGMMTCNLSGSGYELVVDLSKCDKTNSWDEYK